MYPAPASQPQFLIDSILRLYSAVEREIIVPGAGNVAEIALPARLPADPSALGSVAEFLGKYKSAMAR